MSKKTRPEGLTQEEELKWKRARNAKAVKKSDAGYDKVYVRLPKGTAERIKALGYVPATFIRDLTLRELGEIEHTLASIERIRKS